MHEPRGSRGPQPAFSRDQIVQAAIRTADKEGIDAVRMRQIAADLGTKAMSLYRYVRSKEELLDLMVDAATAECCLPEPSGEWRQDTHVLAHVLRSMFRQHPWVLSLSARSTLGPHGLALREATLRVLDGHSLDADQMLLIAMSVSTFVRGYVAEEMAEQQALLRSGIAREQWLTAQTEYMTMVRHSGKYPFFMKIVDEAAIPHDEKLLEERFEWGLEFLLDGITMKLKMS